jgi:O-antigen ligase
VPTNPLIVNNHSLPIQVNKHLVTFCTAAVFLYALSRFWIGAKISAYFEAAFLLPFYYVVFKNWGYFKKQFLTWLVIAMLTIPTLQFCVHYYQDPVLAMKYQGADKLFRLTFFLAPAFWLAHNLKLVNWFILTNILGLITLITIQPNSDTLFKTVLAGSRWFSTDINAAFLALYSGITLIAVSAIFTRIITIKSTSLRAFYRLISILIIVFSSLILISGAIRASIIALIFSALTLIYIARKHNNCKLPNISKYPFKVLFIFILGASIMYFVVNSPLPNHFKSEATNFLKYQEKELTILPDKIGGGRGALWKFAGSKTLEHPIIGWGGEARKNLIAESEFLNSRTAKGLQHSHNAWLDFGLAYGLLGILLLSTLLYQLIRLCLQHWKSNHIPTHIMTYSVTALVFLSIMNLFESYLFFWQGGYLITWIASPAMAYILNSSHAIHSNTQHHKIEAP